MKFYTFLNRKWFFDKVYTEYAVQPALHLGWRFTYLGVDRGLIEMFGPFGFAQTLNKQSRDIAQTQTGEI
jgi:NADH-ubiquinone oxidoreductase chain 5